MSQTDFQTVIQKVVSDEAFAAALQENPEEALKSIGINVTDEMLDAMKSVDAESLKQLGTAFGDDRAAM